MAAVAARCYSVGNRGVQLFPRSRPLVRLILLPGVPSALRLGYREIACRILSSTHVNRNWGESQLSDSQRLKSNGVWILPRTILPRSGTVVHSYRTCTMRSRRSLEFLTGMPITAYELQPRRIISSV